MMNDNKRLNKNLAIKEKGAETPNSAYKKKARCNNFRWKKIKYFNSLLQ